MSESSPRVLVVEDEEEIRRFVCLSLQRDGFEVCEADGVERGLIQAGTRRPDLLVLDLGLPDGDGVDLIRELRTWSDMPILVLSARSGEDDKVEALDAGADDYLVKPFGASELLARVRAHLRRRAGGARGGMSVVEFGDVKIDLARRIIERAGKGIHATPIEIPAAHPPGSSSTLRADASSAVERGMGPQPLRGHALPAGLHGPVAKEARAGPGAAKAPSDRDRNRLPLRAVGAPMGPDAPIVESPECAFPGEVVSWRRTLAKIRRLTPAHPE